MLEFDSPKEKSSYIKVIGVGGGGSNAVNNMFEQGIQGVDFIVCNTDMKSLNNSPVPNKIILGELGAGNNPEVARKAALDHKDDIREAIANNTQMLFITAGMGGGTGTGAAPVIAEIAKQIELQDETVNRILVVAIVTVPFSFEGRKRRLQAESGIEELRKHVDSILVINNDKLRSLGNMMFSEAFKQADGVLYTAVKGIAEIITVSAYVNIDFHDVNTVMENSGTALMGAGMGTGETRAMDAIKEASTSVLLNDNDISGAKNVLLYFSYSPNHEISMDELGEVTDYITSLTGDIESDVIWGAGSDDSLSDELKITLIATGFDKKITGETGTNATRVIQLGNTEEPKPVTIQSQDDNEMRVITREEPVQQEPAPANEVNAFDQIAQRVSQATVAASAMSDIRAQVQPRFENLQQPVQQPVQQPAPQVTSAPVEQGHRYVLDGDNFHEAPYKPQDVVEDKTMRQYSDGIQMVQHIQQQPTFQQPVAEVPQPTYQQPKAEVPQQPVFQQHVVETPQQSYAQPTRVQSPTAEVFQQPANQVFQQPIDQAPISYNSIEEKAPEASVIEPILKQSMQVEMPEAEVAVEEAPVAEDVIAQDEEREKAARARATKIERIRNLHDLLRNNPDGPAIVEKMRTEELTNEEIFRAPHSSQSEKMGSTVDKRGNMRSINNFLFGRPD